MAFINTEGMSEFSVEMNNIKAFQKLQKYFDTLFGVQKTLGNASNIWKAQAAAIKSAAAGVSAAIRGDTDASEKVGGAIESLDAASMATAPSSYAVPTRLWRHSTVIQTADIWKENSDADIAGV